jgi:RimJ/RimL family protein N-acetyltransferase
MTRQVLQTERLRLCHLHCTDGPFIVELLNEPSWRRYIGDKNVHTVSDAERYIKDGPVAMYARLGFGLYLVELKERGEPIGICGLIKRDTLADIDLGFAFLSRFWGNGYAFESAAAVISHAKKSLGIDRIVAITTPGNLASGNVLRRLGFTLERAAIPIGGEDLMLYALTPPES